MIRTRVLISAFLSLAVVTGAVVLAFGLYFLMPSAERVPVEEVAVLVNVMEASPSEAIFATASLELARAAVRARDEGGLPVVGFDLAGQEDGYPADNHVAAFQYVQEHFLKKSVHAGEAYGPESIFQAITALHADRIGHGYYLFSPERVTASQVHDPQGYVRALIEYVADRRITIEVCVTSNLQTNPELGSPERHPFRHMLDHRLSATICTDNRLVSHTTVTGELELAVIAPVGVGM